MILRTRRVIEIDPAYFERLAGTNGAGTPYNEVIMVLPRPGGRVLVGSKYYYPHELFRLPSGKIRPLESPEEAFFRESWEETGLLPTIESKIAEIYHHCICGDASLDAISHVFLGSRTTSTPRALDSSERVSAYREIGPPELLMLRDRLMSMLGAWQGFGRFRAHAHQVVYDYLTSPASNADR